MSRARFPLTSDQLELLMAFSRASGLSELSRQLAKDPSVVSRRLQKLAETAPVITKVDRRWIITESGSRVIQESERFLEALQPILKPSVKSQHLPLNGALLVINAQKALLDPKFGIELHQPITNIKSLLDFWRQHGLPIFHITHYSENPQSPFFCKSKGYTIIDELLPASDEAILKKNYSSGFKETDLKTLLETKNINSLVITGFTGNECIDATTRDACELGFDATVVSDGSASLGFYDKSGEYFEASRVHKLMLANIETLYGRVVKTNELLRNLV